MNKTKRERLTDAARRLIHARGYTQTTLADIAEAAEVPLGNIYYYFRTKEDLMRAVIASHRQDFDELIADLSRLQDPRARIDGYLSMLVLGSENVAAHGCPLASLCNELNKGSSELGHEADAMLEAQLHWLIRQFREMGKSEEEAGDLAEYLLVQLQGASTLTHVTKDPNLFTRQIVAAKAWLNKIA